MNKIKSQNQYSNWQTIHNRVGFYKNLPKPGTYKHATKVGAIDGGELEYNGEILRFLGRKKKISISSINEISLIKGQFKLIHFFLLWIIFSIFNLLILSLILGIIPPTGSILMGLIETIGYWLMYLKYGFWVKITFGPSDKPMKKVYFSPFAFGGGGKKLYNDLIGLIDV